MAYTVKLDALGQFIVRQGSDRRQLTIQDDDQCIVDAQWHRVEIANGATHAFNPSDTGTCFVWVRGEQAFQYFNDTAVTGRQDYPDEGFFLSKMTGATTFYIKNVGGTSAQYEVGIWEL